MRLAQTPLMQQPELIRNYTLTFLCILMPFSVILSMWGEPLVVWFLGDKWQQAGYIATLLAPIGLFQGMSSVLMVPLTTYRKQALAMVFQVLRLILFIIALTVGYIYGDVFLSFKMLSLGSAVHFIIVLAVMLPLMRAKYSSKEKAVLRLH